MPYIDFVNEDRFDEMEELSKSLFGKEWEDDKDMKRIYCDEICNPKTEEANEFLLGLYDNAMIAQEYFDEDEYKAWVRIFYNNIREKLKMPNKVFSIVKSGDNTQARIVLFPVEPDGTYYKVGHDKELNLPYILVEE